MTAPEPNQDTTSLIFETSPYGNIDAIVEHDGRAVFFYLNGEDFGTRACWVRNLVPGPYVINMDELKSGIPPLLPRTHCKYSDGRPCPDPDQLSIVWMEEGNAAALFESDQLLAMIPPWSGITSERDDGTQDIFHGYADECAAENPICWPMPDHAQLHERIENSRSFWNQFQDADLQSFHSAEPDSNNKDHSFKKIQTQAKTVLTNRFQTATTDIQYLAMDGGQFPMRGMLQFRDEHHVTMTTVGMSMCPQPNVELQCESPSLYRRIELAIQLSAATAAETVDAIQSRFSAIASYPWRKFNWYGPGHSVELLDGSDEFGFALLAHDVFVADTAGRELTGEQQFPSVQNDPVNLLWLIPISNKERSSLENQSKTPLEILTMDRLPHISMKSD